jgi:preprotein translocase SecF subunit
VFDIIGKRRWFFALSLAITIPGLIFIVLGFVNPRYGLQFAIDFTGGTVWTIRFEDPNVNPDQVKAVLAGQGIESNVTQTGQGFIEIRTKEAALAAPAPTPTPVPTLTPAPSGSASGSPATSPGASPSASAGASSSPGASPSPAASPSPSPAPSASASPSGSPAASAGASASPGASPSPSPGAAIGSGGALPTQGKLGEIRFALEDALGKIAEQQSLSSVGAVVSSDLITQALVLILVGSIGILLWITYRFRDFRMGATALVALLHDVLVVVGIFAILGTFAGLQIDSLFVTAMLTVIGFSVHDTIVVFDRVRENRARHVGEPFDRIVNHSILQTLGRSITTSLTVVITLMTLLLFAGEAIGTFVLALLIGIISGTYSSIFNAAPLLVVWHLRDDKRREAELAARPSRRPAT